MDTQLQTTDRFIRIDEVLHISGLSRSSLYASIKRGEFPQQAKLSSKASGWVLSEVHARVEGRLSLRKNAHS